MLAIEKDVSKMALENKKRSKKKKRSRKNRGSKKKKEDGILPWVGVSSR